MCQVRDTRANIVGKHKHWQPAVDVGCCFGGQQCPLTLRPDSHQQRILKRKRI